MTTKAKQDPAAIIRDLRRQLAESEKERAAAVELAEKQRKKILELEKRVGRLEGVKMGLQTINVISPDLAQMHGQLEATRKRAELAENEARELQQKIRQEIGLRVEMMNQLVSRNLPIPARLKLARDPLRIESQVGQVRLVASDGLVVFDSGAALERVITQLIAQASAAFPETFTEVL